MGCCLSNTLSLQHLQTWTLGFETTFFGVLSAILGFLFTSGHLHCFSTTNQNRPSNGSFESRSFRQGMRSTKTRGTRLVFPNLVPRALVTLVQRNGKTKTSGKMRLSSAFHWPLTERAQFHRKFINNNFVPRFSILSRARWTCTLWVRSLRARTWRTKQSLLRHINQQHVRRCCNFSSVSNRNDMFGAYLRARTLRVLYCEGNRF